MTISGRWWMTAAVIVGVLSTPSAAQAQSVPGFEAVGGMSVQVADEAQESLEAITALVEQNPAHFGGVRLDGPDSVTVSMPDGPDKARLAAVLRGKAPGLNITIERVARSREDVARVKDQIVSLMRDGGGRDGLVGVGVDGVRGVVTVYATAESAAARVDLKRRFGSAIVFRQMGELKNLSADRNLDTAPHWGGAGYWMWNDAHTDYTGWCSTAFPVIRSGVTYELTAGHCMPGSTAYPDAWATGFTSVTPPSSSYYFGTRYTTTIAGTIDVRRDGTQDLFGDWALLRGSTYYPRVYSCANLTGVCSSLPVGTASWVTPVINAGVCTSGRTTGQVCRQHVTDVDFEAYIDGVLDRQLAVFARDDGGCGATVDHGDSGGAVYQGMSSRPGYVRAMGIVTGGDDDRCFGVYTKLSGVRAWDPSISMPTL